MQFSLFGRQHTQGDETFGTLKRRQLSPSAWLDYAPCWYQGHDSLFELVRSCADWELHRREMYQRVVEVPRLVAGLPGSNLSAVGKHRPNFDGQMISVKTSTAEPQQIAHTARLLQTCSALLSRHYQRDLSNISLGYYRSGQDSVAFHGDKLGALRQDTVVAILSLGVPRNFLLRPALERTGPRLSFCCGMGDLLVMGGDCQESFEHALPKCKETAARIAVMFREPLPQPLAARMPSPGYQAITTPAAIHASRVRW